LVIESARRKTRCRSTKWNGIAVAALMMIVGLAAGCGGSESAKEGSTVATTTAENTTESRPAPRAPTDAQVKEAFESFINGRANSGVMLAQSVTSVTVTGGVVTVTVDAKPVVLELSPFDNLAKLFGTPVAFNDDDGVWLRQTVQRVDVADANGKSLGSMTAAELNKMGAS
jgi:ABC-type Fe3+-citrate transport system substrate-binding protein